MMHVLLTSFKTFSEFCWLVVPYVCELRKRNMCSCAGNMAYKHQTEGFYMCRVITAVMLHLVKSQTLKSKQCFGILMCL